MPLGCVSRRAELRDRQGDYDEKPARGRGFRGRGQRGRDRENFRDRDPRDRELDEWERDRSAPRDDWSRDRERRYDETDSSPATRGRYDDRDRGGYGQANGPPDDRLEQAKKVQEVWTVCSFFSWSNDH